MPLEKLNVVEFPMLNSDLLYKNFCCILRIGKSKSEI